MADRTLRKAENLKELREKIGAIGKERLREFLPTVELCHLRDTPSDELRGLPKGALTEVGGSAKTEFVASCLRQNSDLRVVWLEDSFTVNPRALIQRGVKLENILFVDAGPEVFWAALQALHSQIFSVVVVKAPTPPDKSLRRLQLAAEQSGAAVLYLTQETRLAWPFALHLNVQKGPTGTSTALKVQQVRRSICK